MAVGVLLVLAGVLGLAVFGWFVWPPLALLPVSVASLASGLLTDWESLHGKPVPPTDHAR